MLPKRIIAKQAGKALFRSLGLDVTQRRDPLAFLVREKIQTILDIGANEGQFASRARRLFPGASIHSFEPLAAPFQTLVAKRARDPKFSAYRIALGESDTESIIHLNAFSPSSSILEMTDRHKFSFPWAIHTTPVKVSVNRLDTWAQGQSLIGPMLAKIDVQGFEDKVLRGGIDTMRNCAFVICEVSFYKLYEGQSMFGELYQSFRNLGFECMGMIDNLHDSATGRILQSDAIFGKQ